MSLVLPNTIIRCPYCRVEFHPGDAPIKSLLKGGTEIHPAPQRGSLGYLASRVTVRNLTGPKYTTELARRACPHCQRLLPEHERDRVLNIAIIGDTSSGKTHFIAVLIDQLRRGMLVQTGHGGSRLTALTPETERLFRDNYDVPIIRERNARLPGTARGTFNQAGQAVPHEPLAFQLLLQEADSSRVRTINLLFYDLPGEEIADSTLVVQFGEHILRADAMIYLADPLTMGKMREKLPAHLRPSLADISARSSYDVLNTVISRFEQYQSLGANDPIDIPVAVMLPKSDLLKYTIPVSQHRNYLIFQPKIYDGAAHPTEFARIHQEVAGCLDFFGEQQLLQISRRFRNLNFFAVSATGGPPNVDGKYVALEPLHCLDPFLWVLWKLGFVPTR